MSDEEYEKIRAVLYNNSDLLGGTIDELISDARIGAAVQPKPLSVISLDDTDDYLFWWPCVKQWAKGSLIEQTPGKFYWYRFGRPTADADVPSHAIPISALPTPQSSETGRGE